VLHAAVRIRIRMNLHSVFLLDSDPDPALECGSRSSYLNHLSQKTKYTLISKVFRKNKKFQYFFPSSPLYAYNNMLKVSSTKKILCRCQRESFKNKYLKDFLYWYFARHSGPSSWIRIRIEIFAWMRIRSTGYMHQYVICR
jgi:hypothetical protein